MIETPLRPRIDLNLGWEFLRKKVGRGWLAGNGGDSELVSLPHCWNTHDTFQYGRRSYSGWGAYRRAIEASVIDYGGQWRLCSGGFYGVGDVWLDGRRLTTVDGQYLGISLDLPGLGGERDHLLAFRLDNRWRRNVLPGFRQPDFILHGGLAGGVWLEGVLKTCFDVDRIEISSTPHEGGGEDLTIRWALETRSPSERATEVEWRLTGPDGDPIDSARDVVPGADTSPHTVSMFLKPPKCWHPDEPNLYWAEGRLSVDGEIVDVVRIRFGITRAEFRPRQGFFLDGERVELRGCNRHEAIPGLGNALPPNLQYRDARILKDLGCNFVRLSHYPQSPHFLDACDELGIMVYAEIATWKSVRSSRRWRRAARRQMRDMVTRDRHHPSIILWGMGNESRSQKAYFELRDIAHQLDPTRCVTYAENHLYRARRHHTVGIPDVWGVNYELDVLEEGCASSRLENVVVSECCNHPASVRGDDHEELTQVYTLERDWEIMADRPYVAGHTVWCLTDYATEHRDRFRRLPGLLDAWRQPKLAAELFRARYSAIGFVSLFITAHAIEAPPSVHRREHKPLITGGGLFLHVFSNCDGVRLSQNGAFLALLEGAFHHVVEIDAKFTEIIATGSRARKMVQASYRVHGDAERVEVTAPDHPLASGGLIELDISIRDGSGLPVRDWNGPAKLEFEGRGRLCCFTEDGTVEVSRGCGRVYFEPDRAGGAAVVTASADGLSSGSVTVGPADP